MGAPPGGNPYAAGGVYSRYVPYDAHANGPAAGYAPPPPAAHSAFPSSFPSLGRPSAYLPTHAPSAAGSAPAPAPVPAYVHAPAPAAPGVHAPAQPPLPAATQGLGGLQHPGFVRTAAPGGSSSPPSALSSGSGDGAAATSAPNSQRLLGNKSVAGGGDLLSGLGSPGKDDDVNVITASSTSSAVL
jgi:hypothetical protein